mmetsp:Transcript_44112/g.101904  ORF Transcript_44112/g.101904 Transcript_44112/m.101904 type:complete len:209 (-) Transcript_44112:19-645(-)
MTAAYPNHALTENAADLAADQMFSAGSSASKSTLAESSRAEATPDVPSFAGGIEEEETYEDGSCYKGQLVQGKRHGCGVWSAPTESYFGQWKNDHRDGEGRQTWQDERARRVYEGQFKAGNFDGYGRMEWHTANGTMVYEGQYSNDLKHGTGRYSWPDGREFNGQWRYGQRWGRATFTNAAGLKRESMWREDKFERWVDGNTWERADA